ncbi:MAG: HAD hydrolase family protein [Oligoflexia bacterium]|nr:HAD hydrolase family protein [Oligoflexia bacterium]
MFVLGIIIAKKISSLSESDKNIMPIAGKPIISYVISSSLKSKKINRTIVSTNDTKIADVAHKYGADIPYLLQTTKLASDSVTSEDILRYTVKQIELESNQLVDIVVLLQPTSIFTTSKLIDECVQKFLRCRYDSLITVVTADKKAEYVGIDIDKKFQYVLDEKEKTKLIDKIEIVPSGNVSVINRNSLFTNPQIITNNTGVIYISKKDGLDISYELDFLLAEFLIEENNLRKLRTNDCISPTAIRLEKDKIQLIVYDFDGVMTNNKVSLSENGKESVVVNRGDGQGVSLIKKMGIKQIILSSEVNPVVSIRGKKLNIPVIQGAEDKFAILKDYVEKNGINLKNVVYIGNDLNDLECMQNVGMPLAPIDAHEFIKTIAKIILVSKGGDGVVRELANKIEDNSL